MANARSAAARAIALIGPQGSGKTSLLEALLFAGGAIDRLGEVNAGSSVGDITPEARERRHTVEMNVAQFEYEGDRYALLDLPGSIEFASEADPVLAAVDLAIVVTEPDPNKAILLQPIFKELERLGVPRLVFVNKIDQARTRLRDLLEALQTVSQAALVARQIPIWENEAVSGYVDLALERAYVYRPGQASVRIEIPHALSVREHEARFHMLEQLADYDDALMERLLLDETPELAQVFEDLVKDMQAGRIAPVFFGQAITSAGARRLLKSLRHDTPGPEAAAERVGAGAPSAYALKISHAGQSGKQVLVRAFCGRICDGADLTRADGETGRVGGVTHLFGARTKKVGALELGEVGALGRLDLAQVGERLSTQGASGAGAVALPERAPVYALAISTTERKDDVRLNASFAKLMEEDHALHFGHEPETHELVLKGQGEIHLRVTLERLKRRYGLAVATCSPKHAYRETIRKPATQRGRHKKQSGGHGQYGDVVLELKPQARGAGFTFEDRVVGGVVPRQWIAAVEMGVIDALEMGPLGFPIVDLHVALVDGSHHAVDSSEIAFRMAGRIAMAEALPLCDPILLETIEKITIFAPSNATSRINSMLSSRRGQILGFDARADWPGWDQIEAYIPQAERSDLIIELRSHTMGLGGFKVVFDHMAELNGRIAQDVIAKAKAA
jgi:elongation factor G